MNTAIKTKAELNVEIEELKAQLAAQHTAPEVGAVPTVETTTHIPRQYQEAVNTILNSNFKVEIDYPDDSPTFMFSILVPKKYSNASDPHWLMYGEDRRSRVVNNADGPAGVKAWVQKVYDNFDMETKAKITSDRNKL